MIGLIVPDLVHPFFAEIARSISQAIRPKGYNLVIASSEGDPELERHEIDSLTARQVDALVLASAQTGDVAVRSPVYRLTSWASTMKRSDSLPPGISSKAATNASPTFTGPR
jgi:LacI family transcriptional regulator